MKTYTNPVYPYTRAADLSGAPRRWPVIVAGAGPVGLTAAIDLAQRGIDVLVVDDDNTVSVGSRAICWSKRALEILDRLGCGERGSRARAADRRIRRPGACDGKRSANRRRIRGRTATRTHACLRSAVWP